MSIPIALQLYSVRDDCAQDLLGTIAKVAKMGYDGVEFAGYHGHSAAEIRQCLDDNGLKCAGTHAGFASLQDDQLEETVEFHIVLGCQNLVVPWLPEETRNTPEATKETADKLNDISAKLKPHNMRTGFHVHAGDMKPLSNGRSAWDLLGEYTTSDFIMQYDTANGMAGGADPVQPILDWPGRGLTTHLKEWSGEHGAKSSAKAPCLGTMCSMPASASPELSGTSSSTRLTKACRRWKPSRLASKTFGAWGSRGRGIVGSDSRIVG